MSKKGRILIDLTGKRFQSLFILGRTETFPVSGGSTWYALCACGNKLIVAGSAVRRGFKTRCEICRAKKLSERSTTHGHTSGGFSPTYHSWAAMITRTTNPNRKQAKDYIGRGITVCQRWLDSFENFLTDMGKRPEGKTLDRIDNNGNYELSNCRWATRQEQNTNKRPKSV